MKNLDAEILSGQNIFHPTKIPVEGEAIRVFGKQ